jgi:predicted  nucleic acid-binding Zn-ribbon protein
MYKHTCLYCGKEFESPRRVAQFCPGKSTCRVGYRRREKKAEATAAKAKADAEAAAARTKAEAEASALLRAMQALDCQLAEQARAFNASYGAEAFRAALAMAFDLQAAQQRRAIA